MNVEHLAHRSHSIGARVSGKWSSSHLHENFHHRYRDDGHRQRRGFDSRPFSTMCFRLLWLLLTWNFFVLADDTIIEKFHNALMLTSSTTEAEVKEITQDHTQFCQLPGSFHCDDTQCIPGEQKCNGVAECTSGLDESIQECGCLDNEFFCNGTCIDLLARCDTKYDCDDHTDEQDCETFSCPTSYFKCRNHFCIPNNFLCNFIDDCGDQSDEIGCAHRKCWFGEFRCKNGKCIRAAYVCDGNWDCLDGSDEAECDLQKNFVRCGDGTLVHQMKWCDDWVDCPDNHADELSCRACKDWEFRCANTRCISKGNLCDMVCDCAGTCEDEEHCEHKYYFEDKIAVCLSENTISCNNRCIGADYICNEVNECKKGPYGADEHGCSANYTAQLNDFQCLDSRDRRYIPYTARCNFQNDCVDASDEKDCHFPVCNATFQFTCRNGECIDLSLRCDTFYDCVDHSDEMNCSHHVCPQGFFQCENGQCIPEYFQCDYVKDCLDGSDETPCPGHNRSCGPNEFRCHNGQCIEQSERCYYRPGRTGCADRSHLRNCKEWQCPQPLFKCRSSFCIDPDRVCDSVIDCQETWTDEDNCPFKCSEEPLAICYCVDITINCTQAGLTLLPANVEKEMSRFILSGNSLTNALNPETFRGLGHISFLDLSNNSLKHLQPLTFQYLHRLKILILNDNRLSHIRNGTFIGLGILTTLNLERNYIQQLDPFTFYGLSSLQTLDLHHQQLQHIAQNTFVGLRRLQKLNLSHNKITYLVDGVFNGMPDLHAIDISHNTIKHISIHVFLGFRSLRLLNTDEFRFCCLARQVEHCYPKPDEFSSCEDLMSNTVLRVCVWALGIVAFVGNVMVIIWRLIYRTTNKVHSYLITNLAFGDMLMGVYLLVIAIMDAHYRGVYFFYDSIWRQSALCHFVGFVSTFSSELSVFTLTVITLDRFVSIIFPFRMKRLKMKQTRIVMSAIWVLVSFLAALPLCDIQYFQNFYGRSGVCLALHITNEKHNGWEYSVFVFLALNFVSFSVIAVSYVWMYAVAHQTHRAVRSPEMKRDTTMAKRMTLIVFTDFCCWMPIIGLGIASLSGAQIPPQVFAWIAVFILPLNAAINPILYTLSTAPFLGVARKRVSTFRRSFMTSMSGETHRTVVSTFGSQTDDKDQCCPSTNDSDSLHTDRNEKCPTSGIGPKMGQVDGEIVPLKSLTQDHRSNALRRSCSGQRSNGRAKPRKKYGFL